jgi:hypothetical protein
MAAMSLERDVQNIAKSLADHREDFARFAGRVDNVVGSHEVRITALNEKVNANRDDHAQEHKDQSKAGRDWFSLGLAVFAAIVSLATIGTRFYGVTK